MGRALRVFAALLVITAALTGCGKKNSPVPPPGTTTTYPQTYPHE